MMLHKHPVQWQTKQTTVQMDKLKRYPIILLTQYCTCQFAEIGKIICAVWQCESGKKKREKPLELLWTKLLVYVVALKGMGIAFLELWLKK